ncbi:hypothetical protein D3C84_451870 [compost metagenome]
MIQAFRGDFWVTTESSGTAKKHEGGSHARISGYPAVAGLRRRAILSGLSGSGHPQADSRAISAEKNR